MLAGAVVGAVVAVDAEPALDVVGVGVLDDDPQAASPIARIIAIARTETRFAVKVRMVIT